MRKTKRINTDQISEPHLFRSFLCVASPRMLSLNTILLSWSLVLVLVLHATVFVFVFVLSLGVLVLQLVIGLGACCLIFL